MNPSSDGQARSGNTALAEAPDSSPASSSPASEPGRQAMATAALLAGTVLAGAAAAVFARGQAPRGRRPLLGSRASAAAASVSVAMAGVSLGLSAAGILPQVVRQFAGDRPHSLQGAGATHPAEIPPGGWWDIARRTYGEIGRDRVLAVSAGVTFYAILALFPTITAFVSLYGLFADPAEAIADLTALQGLVPQEALGLLGGEITRIAAASDTTLGIAFAVALILSLWSANSGVKALIEALNVAYGEEEKRGFIRLNLISLAFTAGLLVFALVALAAIAGVPVVLNSLYLSDYAEWLIWLGRWPALLLVLMLGLSILYRFGPSRDRAQWRWVSAGACFATIAWLAGSLLFSWYVANFQDYNATYGTLGAMMALLMWIWLSATIIVLGAEINSETERQTFRDTTVGTPAPIGLRGAEAADNKIGAKSRPAA